MDQKASVHATGRLKGVSLGSGGVADPNDARECTAAYLSGVAQSPVDKPVDGGLDLQSALCRIEALS